MNKPINEANRQTNKHTEKKNGLTLLSKHHILTLLWVHLPKCFTLLFLFTSPRNRGVSFARIFFFLFLNLPCSLHDVVLNASVLNVTASCLSFSLSPSPSFHFFFFFCPLLLLLFHLFLIWIFFFFYSWCTAAEKFSVFAARERLQVQQPCTMMWGIAKRRAWTLLPFVSPTRFIQTALHYHF